MEQDKMSDAEMKKREEIVKSMKKNFKDFRKRYGKRAKDVMYATATKMAMKEDMAMDMPMKNGDAEGAMVKSELRTIIKYAQMLHDMLEDDAQLPAWVQSKIALAQHNVMASAEYMKSEEGEE